MTPHAFVCTVLPTHEIGMGGYRPLGVPPYMDRCPGGGVLVSHRGYDVAFNPTLSTYKLLSTASHEHMIRDAFNNPREASHIQPRSRY